MIGLVILILLLCLVFYQVIIKPRQKLLHEQEYLIAYQGAFKETDKITDWSVSMNYNNFIDPENKDNFINLNNFLGFIIHGNSDIFNHRDLIFVEKTFNPDTTKFPKIVVIITEDCKHYAVRKAIKRTDKGNIIVRKIIEADGVHEEIPINSIIGVVQYDYTVE